MPIIFGGTTVEKVVFGGTEVDKVVFNGVTVFESKPQLATPQNVSVDGTVVSWDEVENATSYEVLADGTSIGTVTPSVVISFTIAKGSSSTSYQAEDGMTWAQWVASSYNTAEFYISGTSVYEKGGSFAIENVNSTDAIIANRAYTLGLV